VVSPDILREYKEVLARKKFGMTREQQQKWFELLDQITAIVEPGPPIDFPRDQKDAAFLACALAANADYLITGDRDFTEARKLVTTTILPVGLFKKLVCDSGA